MKSSIQIDGRRFEKWKDPEKKFEAHTKECQPGKCPTTCSITDTVGGNQPIEHLYFPYGHPFLLPHGAMLTDVRKVSTHP